MVDNVFSQVKVVIHQRIAEVEKLRSILEDPGDRKFIKNNQNEDPK